MPLAFSKRVWTCHRRACRRAPRGNGGTSTTIPRPLGTDKADAFLTLREANRFTDETAVRVATERGSSVTPVGELLAYRELLEADWDGRGTPPRKRRG